MVKVTRGSIRREVAMAELAQTLGGSRLPVAGSRGNGALGACHAIASAGKDSWNARWLVLVARGVGREQVAY